MDMEDRQGMKKNIIGLPAPGCMKSFEIGDKVTMCDFRPFGAASCPAGIDDYCCVLIGGRVGLSVYSEAHIETIRHLVISNEGIKLFRLSRIKKDTFLQIRQFRQNGLDFFLGGLECDE